jgi:hypothetical protein
VLFASAAASGQPAAPPQLTSNRPGIGDSEALVGGRDVSAGVLVRGPGDGWFLSGGLTLRRLPRRVR